MDILGIILIVIGLSIFCIGICIGAFMLNWIFGTIITGLVLFTAGSLIYEKWLES